jgi:hypothetical protein
MQWTIDDIKKLKLGNNYTENVPGQTKNVIKLPKIEKVSIEKETIKKLLWVFDREGLIPGYVEELQFSQDRKFRFDWAIPELMIAIEYEGLISKKSRHTTIKGYSNDCSKYNFAQSLGWIVLRYTVINYKELGNDLKNLLKM